METETGESEEAGRGRRDVIPPGVKEGFSGGKDSAVFLHAMDHPLYSWMCAK